MFVIFLKKFEPGSVNPAIKKKSPSGLFFLMAECQWRESLLRVADFGKSEVSDEFNNKKFAKTTIGPTDK